ncbi:MAG: alpha/beta hydrolase [Patescibacteria group bacterium]
MKRRNIFITNRFGEELEALTRRPEKKGKFPAVLFVSGLGADLHEDGNSFDEISRLIVKNGYTTVQFSFAGTGKSQGNYAEMTFVRLARQIEDVLSWLMKHKNIDIKKIGIIAQSCGAPSTLLTDLTNIKSVLFLSGAFNTYANLKRKFIEKKAYNPGGISYYPRTSGKSDPIGSNFWKVLETYDEIKQANELLMPVFLATGDQDSYVYPDNTKRIYEAIPHEKKRLKIYKDGDHGLEKPPHVHAEFLRDVVEWCKSTL